MHDPQFADIYHADPSRIIGGDAHPNSIRPCAVVQPGPQLVKVLGRSASGAHQPPHTLRSAAEPSCGLNKPGVFDERHQHALWRDDMTVTPYHQYKGALPADPARELQEFWDGLADV